MEFRDLVRRRRMVRNYDPSRPVPSEVVDRILRHAVRAPSAGYSQGWAFLVLEEPADRERFWRAATPESKGGGPEGLAGGKSKVGGPEGLGGGKDNGGTRWLRDMRTAPLIIVAHSNKDRYLDRYAEPDKGWTDRDEARWPVPYWHIDAGFASLLMLLTAVDEGLGACFFGIPPERTATYRAAFGVPEEFTPIGAVSVGYPAPDQRSGSLGRGRRPSDEVVHRGRWNSA